MVSTEDDRIFAAMPEPSPTSPYNRLFILRDVPAMDRISGRLQPGDRAIPAAGGTGQAGAATIDTIGGSFIPNRSRTAAMLGAGRPCRRTRAA